MACWFCRNHTIAARTVGVSSCARLPIVVGLCCSSDGSAGVVSWVANLDVSNADSSNCCFDGLLCLSLPLLSCSFAVLESCSRDSGRRKKNSLISCLIAIFASRGNRSLTLVSDSVVPWVVRVRVSIVTLVWSCVISLFLDVFACSWA